MINEMADQTMFQVNEALLIDKGSGWKMNVAE